MRYVKIVWRIKKRRVRSVTRTHFQKKHYIMKEQFPRGLLWEMQIAESIDCRIQGGYCYEHMVKMEAKRV